MPSGRLIGHTQAKKVEVVSAKAPAPSRIGAGADVQNLFRHIFKVNISSTKYLSKVYDRLTIFRRLLRKTSSKSQKRQLLEK